MILKIGYKYFFQQKYRFSFINNNQLKKYIKLIKFYVKIIIFKSYTFF